jgi:hypothetical protein
MADEFDEDTNLQPTDPFQAAVEGIQFGDIQDGAQKLRSAIGHVMDEGESNRRLQQTITRSMEELSEFRAQNPGLKDDLIEAAVERRVIQLQLDDIKAAGADVAAWTKTLGHEPTPFEISQCHLNYRANGLKGVRTASALLEAASDSVATRFNIQRKAKNPSETVLAQKNLARLRRGLPPVEDYSRSTDSDPHVATTVSPSQYAETFMGFDKEGSAESQIANNRQSAAEKMKYDRLAARGRKPDIYR